MIQRKQTVFLFLAFVAMVLNFIFPIAKFIGGGDYQIEFYLYKLVSLVPDVTVPVDNSFFIAGTAFAGVVALGSLISIFFYNNRILQAKVVRMLVIFTLAQIAVLFFYSIPAIEKISGNQVEYNYVGIAMPLVAFLMLVLAVRGIMDDEKLVRSADRLR